MLIKVCLNRCKGDIFGLCFYFMLHVYSHLICNWIINEMRWSMKVQTNQICSWQLVCNRITVQLKSSFTFDIAQCIYMYGYTYIYKSFHIVLSFIDVYLAFILFFVECHLEAYAIVQPKIMTRKKNKKNVHLLVEAKY